MIEQNAVGTEDYLKGIAGVKKEIRTTKTL